MAQVENKKEPSWKEIISDILGYIIMLPFIPIALGLILFFGWVLGAKDKSKEDPSITQS
jgi:hypothetical protein